MISAIPDQILEKLTLNACDVKKSIVIDDIGCFQIKFSTYLDVLEASLLNILKMYNLENTDALVTDIIDEIYFTLEEINSKNELQDIINIITVGGSLFKEISGICRRAKLNHLQVTSLIVSITKITQKIIDEIHLFKEGSHIISRSIYL